ncbi:hypothetical protein ACJX0J_022744, partial [Zea mays]
FAASLRHRIKDQTVANVHLAEEANVYIEDDIIVVVRPNIPVSSPCSVEVIEFSARIWSTPPTQQAPMINQQLATALNGPMLSDIRLVKGVWRVLKGPFNYMTRDEAGPRGRAWRNKKVGGAKRQAQLHHRDGFKGGSRHKCE